MKTHPHALAVLAPRNAQPSSRRLLTAALAGGLAIASLGASAQTSPEGGTIVSGSGTITQAGNTTTVITTSSRTIIEYSSFNVGENQSVIFNQPGSDSAVLNRVNGAGNASLIQGTLSSNGQVYIVNPAGVTFSPTAVVNVAHLVAAASNLSNDDFLNGIQNFTDSNGNVVNHSANLFGQNGVVLVGKNVTNNGTVSSADGTIVMVSGQDILIQEGPDSQIIIKATGFGLGDGIVSQVTNNGTIDAGDNGQVFLGAGDLFGLMVLREGNINAAGVTLETGDNALSLSEESSKFITIADTASITINTSELSYYCSIAPNDRLSLNAPGGFNSLGDSAIGCGPSVINGEPFPSDPTDSVESMSTFVDAYARFLPTEPLAVSDYAPIKVDSQQIAALEESLGLSVRGYEEQPLAEYLVASKILNDLDLTGSGQTSISADRLNYVDAQAALDAYDEVFYVNNPIADEVGTLSGTETANAPTDQTQEVRSMIQQAADRYMADAEVTEIDPIEFVEWLREKDPEALETLAGLDELVNDAMPNLGLGSTELDEFKQWTYGKIAPQGMGLRTLDQLVSAAGGR